MGTKNELTVLDKSPSRGVICTCKQLPQRLQRPKSPAVDGMIDDGVIPSDINFFVLFLLPEFSADTNDAPREQHRAAENGKRRCGKNTP